MLDFHGLAGRPAGTGLGVTGQPGITPRTVTRWSRTLALAGARLPLTPELATEVCRRTRSGEDHLARVRIAETLGLAAPAPIGAGAAPSVGSRPSQSDQAAAAIAVRVLAAVGPLPLPALHGAVARVRRFRSLAPITTGKLAAALVDVGATCDDHGRWRAPAGSHVSERYRGVGDDSRRPRLDPGGDG